MLQRRLLKDRGISLNIVKYLRLHDHKAAVYNLAVVVVLLPEGCDGSLVVHLQHAEPLAHVDACNSGNLSVLSVELQKLVQIHVGHSVPVGEQEGLVPHIILNPLDAASCHGVQSRIHQRHLPRLRVVVVDLHLVVGQVKGHVGGMEEVIGKKLLHHILLISQADDEFMESILGIVLHNVPQNRPLANLDHGLGLQMAFLADPGSESPCQYYNFHLERTSSFFLNIPAQSRKRDAGNHYCLKSSMLLRGLYSNSTYSGRS